MLLQANDYVQLFELEGLRAADRRLGPVGQHRPGRRPRAPAHRAAGARAHLAAAHQGGRDQVRQDRRRGDDVARRPPPQPLPLLPGLDGGRRRRRARLLLQLTLLPVAVADEVAAEHAARPELRDRRSAAWPPRSPSWCTGPRRRRAAAAATVGALRRRPDRGRPRRARAVAAEVPDRRARPAALRRRARSDRRSWSRPASPRSQGDARRTVEQRGIAVNDAKLEPGANLSEPDLLHGRYLLLRRGKANYHLVVRRGDRVSRRVAGAAALDAGRRHHVECASRLSATRSASPASAAPTLRGSSAIAAGSICNPRRSLKTE